MKEELIARALSGLMPIPGNDLPADLVDWLLQLLQGGDSGWNPTRELWPQIIPPAWRRWLSPGDEINRRAERLGRELAGEAQARARLLALDRLVGDPCLAAAFAFEQAGHPDAALLLREFVTGIGPQTRNFAVGSPFSMGFARSETTTSIIARGLQQWKSRVGGLAAQNGTFTNAGGTFVPLSLGVSLLPPMPGPRVRVIGSAEAHVIGSFSYQGRLLGDDQVEWEARNDLSLKSYFAENWTRRVNISLIENNSRPQRYGNTTQIIRWRTTLAGVVVG